MNISSKQRDILFFVVLIFMVRVAWKSYHASARNHTPVVSAFKEEPREQHAKTKAFSIHEADPNVLARIKALQKQIDQTIALVQPATVKAAELQSMKQRLFQLHRTYKHTSPAVALLGPIGYTGIVLKEQRAENDILEISNKLNRMLHTLTHEEQEFIPVKELSEGIQISQNMLKTLTSTEITT